MDALVRKGRSSIYSTIEAERLHQNGRWGGEIHDKQHSINDWIAYITRYAGEAQKASEDNCPELCQRRLVQVAALAVAAIEASDG